MKNIRKSAQSWENLKKCAGRKAHKIMQKHTKIQNWAKNARIAKIIIIA